MEIILVLGGIVFFWAVANAIGGHREYNNQTGGNYPASGNGYSVDGEGGDGAQWQQYTACPMCIASRENQITGANYDYNRATPPRANEVPQNEQTGWQVFRPNEHTATPQAEWMREKRN